MLAIFQYNKLFSIGRRLNATCRHLASLFITNCRRPAKTWPPILCQRKALFSKSIFYEKSFISVVIPFDSWETFFIPTHVHCVRRTCPIPGRILFAVSIHTRYSLRFIYIIQCMVIGHRIICFQYKIYINIAHCSCTKWD